MIYGNIFNYGTMVLDHLVSFPNSFTAQAGSLLSFLINGNPPNNGAIQAASYTWCVLVFKRAKSCSLF